MNKLTVKDVSLQGKRVLMRVDFNVPLDENQQVTSDKRIRAAVPTIEYILEQGGRLVLMSHLGRPKGERIPTMSLKPCVKVLSELIGKEVAFVNDCIGEEVEKAVAALKEGQVLLLENLRFHKEEEKNDPEFARKLAALADVYVNDAFGTAHRAHASTEGVTRFVEVAVSGFLMEKEIRYLVGAINNPVRPFVAVLGGAKISGKIDVISNLLPKVDRIIIGGGMAYTFLKAQGVEIGTSLVEDDRITLAAELLEKAQNRGVKFLLPSDHLVAEKFSAESPATVASNEDFPATGMGLDIGPETIKTYVEQINSAQTVVWNGPMGVFEFSRFAAGTFAIAEALAKSSCLSIIGGGDSVAAVNQAKLQDQMTHISTGGGASLEFLEGKVLPGVAALTDV